MTYISGPMSNCENLNREEFQRVENLLKAKGYNVINPHKLGHKTDNWIICMKTDIVALMKCDSIYMLKGWHRSKGAKLEFFIAWILKYKRVK